MNAYTIDLDFFEREYARRDFDGLLAGLRELTDANNHVEARVALALWFDSWHKRNTMMDYDGCYAAYARALAGLGELYACHASIFADISHRVIGELMNDIYNDVDDELYTRICKAL